MCCAAAVPGFADSSFVLKHASRIRIVKPLHAYVLVTPKSASLIAINELPNCFIDNCLVPYGGSNAKMAKRVWVVIIKLIYSPKAFVTKTFISKSELKTQWVRDTNSSKCGMVLWAGHLVELALSHEHNRSVHDSFKLSCCCLSRISSEPWHCNPGTKQLLCRVLTTEGVVSSVINCRENTSSIFL